MKKSPEAGDQLFTLFLILGLRLGFLPHALTHSRNLRVQTSMMFTGEAVCLVAFIVVLIVRRRSSSSSSLLDSPIKPRRIFQPVLLIPALLDLVGTSCAGIGLLYCEASLYQLLRGSSVVFTSILSWIFLHRTMLPHRWVAIACTIAGLCCVGVSGLLTASLLERSSESSSAETPVEMVAIGVVMVLAGQMVTSCQMVVEELVLKQRKFEPLQVVGIEGLLGFAVMNFLVLPIMFFVPGSQPSPLPYGAYENLLDAIAQLFRNWRLFLFGALYLTSNCGFSFFGLCVTKNLSCVHRTIIDACRTILVWSFELFLFYAIDKDLGEPWTVYSFIQVAGFVLLLLGAALFNGLIRVPGFAYEQNEIHIPKPEGVSIQSDPSLPLLEPSQSSSSGHWDQQ